MIVVRLCFTRNGDHSPENTIYYNTQKNRALWGNKPMRVQLSCHTIKSTTAQTFENAENAQISQGGHVAALKIATAHGRVVSCPSPLCTPEHTAPPANLGPWIFDCIAQPLFDFFKAALKIVPARWCEFRSAQECTRERANWPFSRVQWLS